MSLHTLRIRKGGGLVKSRSFSRAESGRFRSQSFWEASGSAGGLPEFDNSWIGATGGMGLRSVSPHPGPLPWGEGEVCPDRRTIHARRLSTAPGSLLVGKGVALPPLPPRCRDRVPSLYLAACRFPTPGDPRWRRLPRVAGSDVGQSEPPVGVPPPFFDMAWPEPFS